jgi:Fe2+ transport system protein B
MKSLQRSIILFMMEPQEIKTLINQNLVQENERLKKKLEEAETKIEKLYEEAKEERNRAEIKYEKLYHETNTKYEKLYEDTKTKYEKLYDDTKQERERLQKPYFLYSVIVALFILLLFCQFGINEYIYSLLNYEYVSEVADNIWQKTGDFFAPIFGYFIERYMNNNNNIQTID